ncbi:hypothetical protein H105_02939 [Trichophyton soudanense CBS 452.61]|uniref:N-acetyltransferase domain-containing protein n=1 Tax=Trichophyton soudanense CBS 452.61 TaxID=1215331 RepID=A0A022XZ12_TRISD|nr:hypothetical protein H105_02939 [Trichophyton soudanense CBS 452.61]
MEETISSFKLTPRIHLRRYKPSDIDLICMLNEDEGVMKYIDTETPTAEGMEFIGWFRLGDLDQFSQECFSNANTESKEKGLRLELGYRIRRRFWVRG